jgi:hypothetical protein
MIFINPLGPSQATQRSRPTKKARKADSADSSSFSGLLTPSETSTNAVDTTRAASAPANINPYLALQEVGTQDLATMQGMAQAHLTLDSLEDLRDALLTGSIPISSLKRLEAMVKQQRHFSMNAEVNAILDDIELRAAVELAKLEMAQSR